MKNIEDRVRILKAGGKDNNAIRRKLKNQGYDRHRIENALHGPSYTDEVERVERNWFWGFFYITLLLAGLALFFYRKDTGIIFLISICYLLVESAIIYFLFKIPDYDRSVSYNHCFLLTIFLVAISLLPYLGYFKFFILFGVLAAISTAFRGKSRAPIAHFVILFTASFIFTMLIIKFSHGCANHLCI